MNGLKGLVAGLMTLAFIVGAALLVLLYFPGRDLTDSARFSDIAVDQITSPRGAGILAPVIVDSIRQYAAARGLDLPQDTVDTLTRTTRDAIERDEVATTMRPIVRAAQDNLLQHPERPLVIPTGAARPVIAEALDRQVPGAGQAVPPPEVFPDVPLQVSRPARPALRALDWMRDNAILVVLGTAVAAVLALLASPRKAGTSMAMGIGLALLAGLPPLTHWVLPPLAEMSTEGRYGGIARMIAEEATRDWGQVSLALLAIGFGWAILGQLIFRR